jgi:Fe-S-cluster containining protein
VRTPAPSLPFICNGKTKQPQKIIGSFICNSFIFPSLYYITKRTLTPPNLPGRHIFALSYELDNLNDYLKENFSFDEQEHIIARAEAKRDKLDGLRGDALLNSKFACPLLKDGECMAYEARPVSCRIYISSDVDSCKQFYYKPASAGAVPALLDFPMRMGRMINEGFRAALKANGIPVEEHRIEQGIANRYH